MNDGIIIKDIARYYKRINKKTGAISSKFQLPDNIAQRLKFENRQKVSVTYNEETEEICIKAL